MIMNVHERSRMFMNNLHEQERRELLNDQNCMTYFFWTTNQVSRRGQNLKSGKFGKYQLIVPAFNHKK
jgi:hypothetical protein